MRIYFPLETIKELAKAGCKSEGLSDPESVYRGREIESRELVPGDYSIITRLLRQGAFQFDVENKRILKRLQALEDLKNTPPGKIKSKTLKILDLIPEVIRDQIGMTPHKWLFISDPVYGIMLPWFLEDAEFSPAHRSQSGYFPAHVSIKLKAVLRGKEIDKSIVLYKADLKGGTLADILAGNDTIPETPAMVEDYEADLKRYGEHHVKLGEQYVATGHGRPEGDGSWNRTVINLERDGQATKVVMDDLEDQERDTGYTHTDFWSSSKSKRNEDQEASFKLPVHPVARVFSLESHEYVSAHISSLTPYEYDPSIVDKLVLPLDHKNLIDTLTKTSAARLEDIVRGKASGVIVFCSGPPGVGKTLTAEVYSEVVKRPLYSVQCAQLGTDEEELEESLSEVLSRAARWKAILLIDEADVYVHERGDDIHQNAIVGVLLRLLEYFRGIMFMTTNRATIIDDAILSRVTAHVRYTPPQDDDQAGRLWKVLATQYGASGLDVEEAVKTFRNISGRSMRQLLRLSALTGDPKKISVKTLKWAANFYDFPELEKQETVTCLR